MTHSKPYFLTLSRQMQKNVVEALIFSSEDTLTLNSIFNIITEKDDYLAKFSENEIPNVEEMREDGDKSTELFEQKVEDDHGFNRKLLAELIEEINEDLNITGRPYLIVNFAGGYQYSTRPEYGELVQYLIKTKSRKRLSQAVLETLAIVAYKQPVTKPTIEQIRGVNSKDALNSLVEKNLVAIIGRSESVGKPLLYGTTEEFLKIFGLSSIKDLPNLRELDEIANETFAKEELSDENAFTMTITQEQTNEFKEKVVDVGIDVDEQPNYLLNDISLN